jgi:hypothetical protein
MVSSNEASLNLRESSPLFPSCMKGQRMNPTATRSPEDYRGWLCLVTNQKVEISNLNYLISIRDSAKSGLGFADNRHLNYFAESINMNVGDSQQNGNERRSSEVCCESRSRHSSRRLGKPATGRRTAVCWKASETNRIKQGESFP